MEDVEKADLNQAVTEAGKLREMMATPGWKIFSDSIEVKYHDAVKELIVQESSETRQRIKAIQEIMIWPDKILKDAAQAMKHLAEDEATESNQ
jgi:hypothetical protein